MEIGEVVAGMTGGKGCRLAAEAIRRSRGRVTGRRGDGAAGRRRKAWSAGKCEVVPRPLEKRFQNFFGRFKKIETHLIQLP